MFNGDPRLSPIMNLYNYSICLEMRDYNKMQFKISFEMTQYESGLGIRTFIWPY